MVLKKGAEAYLPCPLCDVEVPMSGDEDPGAELYCPYCETPLKLKKDKNDVLFLQDDI